ncbi:hypothetical protein Hypma_007032 [Hypsizygus marmoreus]|uniref:Secreted protein n=1 Tax=Hypsizygus marmoreus TaxID=39966 RepID=A0A369KF43_HYPMA|nr:hypothetical protein Hypma_007032 [Hypsizygus marmoreus]
MLAFLSICLVRLPLTVGCSASELFFPSDAAIFFLRSRSRVSTISRTRDSYPYSNMDAFLVLYHPPMKYFPRDEAQHKSTYCRQDIHIRDSWNIPAQVTWHVVGTLCSTQSRVVPESGHRS